MESLIKRVDELEKAVREGVQGKYRRVDGKTVFIRSDDKKVTKGPDRLKGRKLVMKDTTTAAGMAAQFGSPSAEVMMTDGAKRKKTCKCISKAVCKCETVAKKACGCLEKTSCGCKPVVNSLEKKAGDIHSALSLMAGQSKAH